jgi:hypothetical protein
VKIKYPDGWVSGVTEDQSFVVGGRAVKLSKLHVLQLSPKPEVRMADGSILDGRPAAPQAMTVTVGGQTVRLDLGKAVEIGTIHTEDAVSVTCALVALREGEAAVERANLMPFYLEGAVLPGFAALRAGRFLEPPRSNVSVSYLRIESAPGDPIGQGKNYIYEKEKLTFELPIIVGPGAVIIGRIGGADKFSLVLWSGQGRQLGAGEYRGAKFDVERFPPNDDSPAIAIALGDEPKDVNTISGAFRIWELEINGNNDLVRLAVDFVVQRDGDKPPLVGMLRYNSTFH